MTDQEIVAAGTGPVVLEAGRYKLAQDPGDGSLVLRRATGLCEACTGCGCGDQSPAITVPAMMMRMARSGMMAKMLGQIGGVPDDGPDE
jgi:hypothetical protein